MALAHSDFKQLLKAGKVADLTVTPAEISGTLKPEGLEGILPKERIEQFKQAGQGSHRFVTVPGLVKDLEAANVRFAGYVERKLLPTLLSWIVPAVIFVALWGFIIVARPGMR